jgi:1-acyl-sn-glycerol-3-phosphate acyltransferase
VSSSPGPSGGPASREVERTLRSDANWFIRGMALLTRIITRCLTRVRISGAVDAIPREGALIIASNHVSNADGVLVGAWLTPRLGRRIHWLGKREITEWPVIGWIARTGSIHPVDRDNADIEVFRLMIRILEAGNAVVVFPEGTRSPSGALQPAKDGVAMLALKTNARILPVGVIDTDKFWPRGHPPRPGGQVELRVGEPFLLSDLLPAGLDRRAAKSAATDLIMGRIAELLPARQQGVYARSRADETGDSSQPVR